MQGRPRPRRPPKGARCRETSTSPRSTGPSPRRQVRHHGPLVARSRPTRRLPALPLPALPLPALPLPALPLPALPLPALPLPALPLPALPLPALPLPALPLPARPLPARPRAALWLARPWRTTGPAPLTRPSRRARPSHPRHPRHLRRPASRRSATHAQAPRHCHPSGAPEPRRPDQIRCRLSLRRTAPARKPPPVLARANAGAAGRPGRSARGLAPEREPLLAVSPLHRRLPQATARAATVLAPPSLQRVRVAPPSLPLARPAPWALAGPRVLRWTSVSTSGRGDPAGVTGAPGPSGVT